MSHQNKQQKKTICGIITLYHPTTNNLHNINSYISYIDKLFIIDNTPLNNTITKSKTIQNYPNTQILSTGKNLGIAAALNLGIHEGLKNRYSWLLTMDQDSWFDPEQAERFFSSLAEQDSQTTAIISPAHKETHNNNDPCHYEKKTEVMTSGNILNLGLAEKIGFFNEDLFIDSVDHDYCLKANLMGFDVLQATNCHLQHTIGKNFSGSFFFGIRKRTFALHSPKRLYFIVRNGLYIIHTYGKDFPTYTHTLGRHIRVRVSKSIRYGRKRLEYIKYTLKALYDYKCRKFGNRVNI